MDKAIEILLLTILLATIIWEDPQQKIVGQTFFLSTPTFDLNNNLAVYPNPSNTNRVSITTEIQVDEIALMQHQRPNHATNQNHSKQQQLFRRKHPTRILSFTHYCK